jgi:hypothetical protein
MEKYGLKSIRVAEVQDETKGWKQGDKSMRGEPRHSNIHDDSYGASLKQKKKNMFNTLNGDGHDVAATIEYRQQKLLAEQEQNNNND